MTLAIAIGAGFITGWTVGYLWCVARHLRKSWRRACRQDIDQVIADHPRNPRQFELHLPRTAVHGQSELPF